MTDVYGQIMRSTPQSMPIPGSGQVQNNAGGYGFQITDEEALDRFVILGTQGGTYYVGEQKLTADNAGIVISLIKKDGIRTVERIVNLMTERRVPQVWSGLFSLALATKYGDEATRRLAYTGACIVCNTGTMLMAFAGYREAVGGGWGRGMRAMVGNWMNSMASDKLAYQMVKYRQRAGWTWRDLLRLAHPAPADGDHDWLYRYATDDAIPRDEPGEFAKTICGYELAKLDPSKSELIALINRFGLTWEMLPTNALKDSDVWTALLTKMGDTALLRNLGRMTENGTLGPLSENTAYVVKRLGQARLHPWHVLNALDTYASGSGRLGSLVWTPIGAIVDALDRLFQNSFGNVTPTGKRICVGIDHSGSMRNNMITAGMHNGKPMKGMAAAKAAAALALITAKSEESVLILGFDTNASPIDITARTRLDVATANVETRIGGRTDCASPILYCAEKRIPVDAFVILTDSETWAGQVHPIQALKMYRSRTGIAPKLVVVAMCATNVTIADPRTCNQINVVGFDLATPEIITDFLAH